MKSTQSGFSLVELMMVVGIVAMMGLFVNNLIIQQQKITKTVETSSEIKSIIREITNVVNDREACESNLLGMIPSNAPTPASSWGPGATGGRADGSFCYARANGNSETCLRPIVTIGQRIAGTTLTLQSMQLLPPPQVSPDGVGIAQLRLVFRKEQAGNAQSTVYGVNETTETVPVMARFCQTSAPLIQDAIGFSQSATRPNDRYLAEAHFEQLCQNSGFGPNPFFLRESLTPTEILPETDDYGLSANILAVGWMGSCLFSCGPSSPIATCF